MPLGKIGNIMTAKKIIQDWQNRGRLIEYRSGDFKISQEDLELLLNELLEGISSLSCSPQNKKGSEINHNPLIINSRDDRI